MQIQRHYWRPTPVLPTHLMEAIETSLKAALQTTDNKIDAAFLQSLAALGFDVKPRSKILAGRKFEDDIRLYDGDHQISIEVENYGNRLEFDLLKMMTFAEAVPQRHSAWGCLVVPASKELENPYISGSGRERIWDYLTKRLMPMILPIRGLRLSNIVVLGFDRMNQTRVVESKGGRAPTLTGATLRGLVQHAWMNAGKPSWDIDRAVREAVKFDIHLEQDLNENPAPAFRENRINNNYGYLRSWVLGCKFAWLSNH